MTAYVVDASTAVKLYLPEPLAAQAADLFALLTTSTTVEFHVPDLFYVECGNIFWKQVRKGNCTAAHAVSYDADLRAMVLRRTPTFELTVAALPIA
jgi:predicted nucleic acid-binding protein